jgi:hypothetical protein
VIEMATMRTLILSKDVFTSEDWRAARSARASLRILTVVLCVAIFKPISKDYCAAPQTPQVTWKEFSPKGGRFTVQWPTRFPTDEMDESPNGPNHTFSIDAPLGAGSISRGFVVAYTDLPNIPESVDLTVRKELLNRFAKGFIEAEGKPTDTQRDLMLGSYPGKELMMSPKGTENIVRVYLVGRRFYILTALVPTPAARMNAQRFLDSFKVLTP